MDEKPSEALVCHVICRPLAQVPADVPDLDYLIPPSSLQYPLPAHSYKLLVHLPTASSHRFSV
jgi:hypothetical protein